MGWEWKVFTNGIFGDKNKQWNKELVCPYHSCPSKTWVYDPNFAPIEDLKVPKMKFVQRLGPNVYQYRCKYCGCTVNVGLETQVDMERMAHHRNPSYIGGKPSYKFNV